MSISKLKNIVKAESFDCKKLVEEIRHGKITMCCVACALNCKIKKIDSFKNESFLAVCEVCKNTKAVLNAKKLFGIK